MSWKAERASGCLGVGYGKGGRGGLEEERLRLKGEAENESSEPSLQYRYGLQMQGTRTEDILWGYLFDWA